MNQILKTCLQLFFSSSSHFKKKFTFHPLKLQILDQNLKIYLQKVFNVESNFGRNLIFTPKISNLYQLLKVHLLIFIWPYILNRILKSCLKIFSSLYYFWEKIHSTHKTSNLKFNFMYLFDYIFCIIFLKSALIYFFKVYTIFRRIFFFLSIWLQILDQILI